MKLDEQCRRIELVLSDVDGVMTDGGLWFDNQGIESKRFHVRDGLGIQLWQRAGFAFGVVTGRSSQVVRLRCAELGVQLVRQGVQDKLAAAREAAQSLGLTAEQTCFIGDDLPDLAAIRWAGLGVAVADAVPEVRQQAALVTSARGGDGAVRELIELLLRSSQRWDDLIRRYRP